KPNSRRPSPDEKQQPHSAAQRSARFQRAPSAHKPELPSISYPPRPVQSFPRSIGPSPDDFRSLQRMNLATFFEKFELFADAPNPVAIMRELVLELAIQGSLVEQDQNEAPAINSLKRASASVRP